MVAVLLGGDAGLRAGEMRALEWTDLDFGKRQIRVERSEWRGEVTTTKGNRVRYVPMTTRLLEALQKHRHLRSARVLCEAERQAAQRERTRVSGRAGDTGGGPRDGPQTRRTRARMSCVTRSARIWRCGARRRRAIQELAGHRDLMTTQRYMHLSPAAIESAIRLLELPAPIAAAGDMRGTEIADAAKC